MCSHLFGKVSQQRAMLTTTEARLLHRASYLRYNEPGRSFHRASCYLYVVDEKEMQDHAILNGVMADSEYQLLAYYFTCTGPASCNSSFFAPLHGNSDCNIPVDFTKSIIRRTA